MTNDRNVLPFVHTTLAFLWSLAAFVPWQFRYVEGDVPWSLIATFLNTLGKVDIDEPRVTSDAFPQSKSGLRHLPEDFVMRGQLWSQCYYPANYFEEPLVEEEERDLDYHSTAATRAERCLWIGHHVSQVRRLPFPIFSLES